MILTTTTANGYTFDLRGEMIAVGTYSNDGFILLETDNTCTSHTNGMQALGYLRGKYTPEYYKMPVKPQNVIHPRTTEEQKRIDMSRFSGHNALKGVHPLALE